MRRSLEQFIRWARDVEWAMVAGAITTIIALIPEFANLLEQGITDAGPEALWPALVMAIGLRFIRSNVWSKATVIEIAGVDNDFDDGPMEQSSTYVGELPASSSSDVPGV